MKKKIAIIGCGNLSETIYLPILKNSDHFQLECIVDNNIERLHYFSDKFSIKNCYTDFKEIFHKTDAAIVVAPNAFHYGITKELLSNKINVLVEKPLATSLADCRELIKLSEVNNVKLAVGHVRRFYKNFQFLKKIIDDHTFGNVISFNVREGFYLTSSFPNDTFINKDKSGGGVLIDIGPHVLDLLIWFFGPCQNVKYFDDNMGGVEAECKMSLQFAKASGEVLLSRLRTLENKFSITFEKGAIEIGIASNSEIKISLNQNQSIISNQLNGVPQKIKDAFTLQLVDFWESISLDRQPLVNGEEGTTSVELIERCYKNPLKLNDYYIHF